MGGTLVPYRTAVSPEWIDYNGHLNEGYYVVVFALATDTVLDQLGIGEQYHAATGRSLFTAESHVRYLDQVRQHDDIEVRSRVIGADIKRLRLWHEMVVDGAVRATQEVMALHVDVGSGRTCPLPDDASRLIAEFLVDPPAEAGAGIRPVGSR